MARTKQTARKCLDRRQQKKLKPQTPQFGVNKPNTQMLEEEEIRDIQEKHDTNQFVVKFDDQLECELKAIEQKYIKCSSCQAILTKQNKIYTSNQYEELKQKESKDRIEDEKSDQLKQQYLDTKQNIWICEFCSQHNIIPKQIRIPDQQNPCYLIQKYKNQYQEKVSDNQQILIFCIDVSGSMDMVFQGRSRLKAVKQAIADQLKKMKIEKSKKKVGIITFGSQVIIIGDAKNEEIKLPNAIYNNFQSIINQSQKHFQLFQNKISSSYNALMNIIDQTIAFGGTALGPALLSAIQIASKGSVGSKVIICTDGEANVGIGSGTDESFYIKLSEYAKNKRVGVNILSIKGDRCNLKLLSKVALSTNGSVLKVDPAKLGTQFSKIISDEILGSNSQIVIRFNRRFKFRNINENFLKDNGSLMKLHYGNFTKQSEITYEFDLLSREEAKKIKEINMNLFKYKKLPMQLQISYTSQNLNKYLQIYTDWRQLTTQQEEIFLDANFGIFVANTLQKLSNLIKQQKFDQARQCIANYRKICVEKFSKFEQNKKKIQKSQQKISKLEAVLTNKQKKELMKHQEIMIPRIGGSRGGRGGFRGSRGGSIIQKYYGGMPIEVQEQNDQEQSQQQSQSQKQVIKFKKNRSRSRSKDRSRKKDKKSKKMKKQRQRDRRQVLSSDSEERVLIKEMRARIQDCD